MPYLVLHVEICETVVVETDFGLLSIVLIESTYKLPAGEGLADKEEQISTKFVGKY